MKTIAIALGLFLGASAAAAFAESDRNFPYDPNWAERQQWSEACAREGFNCSSEQQLRELERARDQGYYGYGRSNSYGYGYGYPRDASWECWNPHAHHFENVREGERQDDLDFGHCRVRGTRGVQPYPGYRGYGWR